MRLIAILRIALNALKRNKLRTMLTTLGIVIGNDTRAQLEAQIAGMGQNIIMVFSNFRRGGVSAGVASGQVILGNRNWPSSVYGVSAEYLQIKSCDAESGTMFSQQQVASASKVAIGRLSLYFSRLRKR